MNLDDDLRLIAHVSTEQVSDEHGAADVIVVQLQISGDTWAAALADSAAAASLVEWLNTKR